MKKIAICQFNGRVSPRFNHSAEVVMVTMDHSGLVEKKQVIFTATLNPSDLATLLGLHQIETLICGGVKKDCQQILQKNNIELIDNVIGNVDDVLRLYQKGELHRGDVVN